MANAKLYILLLVASAAFVQKMTGADRMHIHKWRNATEIGEKPKPVQDKTKLGGVLDKAVDYIKEMADYLTEAVEEASANAKDMSLTVNTQFDSLKDRIKSETMLKVNRAIAGTVDKTCQPDQRLQLEKVPESISNRFLECINMTDAIAKLELFIYNVVSDLDGVEDIVCLGLQNATDCTQYTFVRQLLKSVLTSLFGQLPCVSQAIADFITSFKSETFHVQEAVKMIKDFGKEIADHFLNCFTHWSGTADKEIEAIVKTTCH